MWLYCNHQERANLRSLLTEEFAVRQKYHLLKLHGSGRVFTVSLSSPASAKRSNAFTTCTDKTSALL